jgi:hypothetical protein
MINPRYTLAALAGAAALLYLLRRCLQIGRRPADLPPGPPTIPLLGNLHLVSIEPTEVVLFETWGLV